VRDIVRHDFNPAVRIDVSMDELLHRAVNQNFVPVVDDLGTFIGIVTRQDIIIAFIDKIEKG
jgi:CBS domain-containing protein